MEYTIKFPERYVKPELPDGLKWLAALRSGEYVQGDSCLAQVISPELTKYCCLGVLCSVQDRNKVLVSEDNLLGKFKRIQFDRSPTVLSGTNPLLGILQEQGIFPQGVSVRRASVAWGALTQLNDAGFTFLQIADIIEKIWDPK